MQLIAYEDDRRIYAHQAKRRKDYKCGQCGGLVRLRGGRIQKLHFFHPNPIVSCGLRKKSLSHLSVQEYLCKQFSKAFMEYYFPKINRFADVVIPELKLIFEVQCSPITLQEVRARQKAYAKTGYQLIWILHEKTFNKRVITEVEEYLHHFPCYYTNIETKGRGCIYDQHAIYSNVKRLYIGRKCPVFVDKLFYMNCKEIDYLPEFLQQRHKSWPIYFKNDLFYRVRYNEEFAKYLIDKEREIRSFKYRIKKKIHYYKKCFITPTPSILTNIKLRMIR